MSLFSRYVWAWIYRSCPWCLMFTLLSPTPLGKTLGTAVLQCLRSPRPSSARLGDRAASATAWAGRLLFERIDNLSAKDYRFSGLLHQDIGLVASAAKFNPRTTRFKNVCWLHPVRTHRPMLEMSPHREIRPESASREPESRTNEHAHTSGHDDGRRVNLLQATYESRGRNIRRSVLTTRTQHCAALLAI